MLENASLHLYIGTYLAGKEVGGIGPEKISGLVVLLELMIERESSNACLRLPSCGMGIEVKE
jgi:hypothetical protein